MKTTKTSIERQRAHNNYGSLLSQQNNATDLLNRGIQTTQMTPDQARILACKTLPPTSAKLHHDVQPQQLKFSPAENASPGFGRNEFEIGASSHHYQQLPNAIHNRNNGHIFIDNTGAASNHQRGASQELTSHTDPQYYSQQNQYLCTLGNELPFVEEQAQSVFHQKRQSQLPPGVHNLTLQEKQLILVQRQNEILERRTRRPATEMNLNLDLSKVEQRQSVLSPGSQFRASEISQLYNQFSPSRSHNGALQQARTPKGNMQSYKVHTLAEELKNAGKLKKPYGAKDGGLHNLSTNKDSFTVVSVTTRGKEKSAKAAKAYNISDYRTACRTCKDMEVEEFEKVKKQYKRGSLLDAPNTKFMHASKKSLSSNTTFIKPARPSLDLETAWKMVEDVEGKFPEMPRYTEPQLKKFGTDQLIKLIVLLQSENARLRYELEKLRIKIAISEKKGEQIVQLKATIRQNMIALNAAKQALKDGVKLMHVIQLNIDEILKAYRLPQRQQTITLPPLLRKFKHLLEGNYSKADGAKLQGQNPMALSARSGKPSHLQMLDEQSARHGGGNDLAQTMPANSIKSQLEKLVTQLGFEAHKGQALLVENQEEDQKKFDEAFDQIQEKVSQEKRDYQNTVQKQAKGEIDDLRDREAINARELEACKHKIGELMDALERKDHLIHELRVQLGQEQQKYTDLFQSKHEMGVKINKLETDKEEGKKLVAEYQNSLAQHSKRIEDLGRELSLLLTKNNQLEDRIAELKPLEKLKLQREEIVPRLEAIARDEGLLKSRQNDLKAKEAYLEQLQSDISDLRDEITGHKNKIKAKDKKIRDLEGQVDTIPGIEEQVQKLEENKTDLQKRLQDANFEKTRFKEQVEKKDGFAEMQDMVSNLMAAITLRGDKEINFSENQTAIFRSLFGPQVSDQLKKAVSAIEDKDDQKRFSEVLSPRKANANAEMRRETFREGDAERNDRQMKEMLKGGVSQGPASQGSRIGTGLRRQSSAGSKSVNVSRSGAVPGKTKQSQTPRASGNVSGPKPPRHRMPLEFDTIEEPNRQTTPDMQLFSTGSGEEQQHESELNTSKKRRKKQRLQKNRTTVLTELECDDTKSGGNDGHEIFSADDQNPLNRSTGRTQQRLRDADHNISQQKLYFGDEDLLQMIHLQATVLEEGLPELKDAILVDKVTTI